MAKILVSGSSAVMYDGRVLYPNSAAYTVNDTYANKLKADSDVSDGLISITEAFTDLAPAETSIKPTRVESAPVNAVAATLSTALTGSNNDLDYTAKTKGAAGNYIKIKYTDPAADKTACTVAVTGAGTSASPYIIDVTLKYTTDAITATAGDVKTAIEGNTVANGLVSIANKTGNDGTGVVTALAATALSGGVNGTLGEKDVLYTDGSYIYSCVDDNQISDANWRRVSLGTAY